MVALALPHVDEANAFAEHYKLAWIALHAGDELRAFDEMFRVARDADEPLRETAGTDLVEIYARVARPEQARVFFRRVDPRRARRRLEQLANVYALHGRHADAAVVRTQFIG